MRANREIIPPDPNHSVRWVEHSYPSPVARWNYHPEYEIHLIRKGTGKFIVGDHIGTFEAGHVSLVGSGLPHDWVSDLEPGEVLENRDAVIQFDATIGTKEVAFFYPYTTTLVELRMNREPMPLAGVNDVFWFLPREK